MENTTTEITQTQSEINTALWLEAARECTIAEAEANKREIELNEAQNAKNLTFTMPQLVAQWNCAGHDHDKLIKIGKNMERIAALHTKVAEAMKAFIDANNAFITADAKKTNAWETMKKYDETSLEADILL